MKRTIERNHGGKMEEKNSLALFSVSLSNISKSSHVGQDVDTALPKINRYLHHI